MPARSFTVKPNAPLLRKLIALPPTAFTVASMCSRFCLKLAMIGAGCHAPPSWGRLGPLAIIVDDNERQVVAKLIEASRGLIRACAEVLDAGGRGAHESSVAKVFVSEAVGRVVDRSLQICGGLGASDDLPLARYAREVRAFRIYDGPSETHRWSIARRAVRRRRQQR